MPGHMEVQELCHASWGLAGNAGTEVSSLGRLCRHGEDAAALKLSSGIFFGRYRV